MTTKLLEGIVGSTAYGLATPQSDIDRLGVYACPTEMLFTLREPKWTIVDTKPDSTLHEARKFCQLALQCNPTVLELLWLDSYDICTPLGQQLINVRDSFLSARRVRDAYFGYATQQFTRMQRRDASDLDSRTKVAKHARHLYRLLSQGLELYIDGTLTVRLENPDLTVEFGEEVAAGNYDLAKHLLDAANEAMNVCGSTLPEKPATHIVEMWLLAVRLGHLSGSSRST